MYKIVKDNVKSLRNKCVLVDEPISEQDKKTVLEMLEYLKLSQDEEYATKHNIRSGVGLAAPQIGINKRMFVVYVKFEDHIFQYALINPKIIQNSVRKVAIHSGEGCLSVDNDHPGYVYRYDKIVIKAYDAITSKYITLKAQGYESVVLQHEYDHLDGIIYYDRIDKENPFKEIPNSYLL